VYAGGIAGCRKKTTRLSSSEKTEIAVFLSARNRAGLDVPWRYTRHNLAQRWGIRPWEVDEAPWDEVVLAIEIFNLDAKYENGAGK